MIYKKLQTRLKNGQSVLKYLSYDAQELQKQVSGLASHREGNLYLFTRIAKEPVVQKVHLHFTQIIFAFLINS